MNCANRPAPSNACNAICEKSTFTRVQSIHLMHLLHTHRHIAPLGADRKIVGYLVMIVAWLGLILVRLSALWTSNIAAWIVERGWTICTVHPKLSSFPLI